MKKILPLLIILGGTTLAITGCKYNIANIDNNINKDLIDIQNTTDKAVLATNQIKKVICSKYNLEFTDDQIIQEDNLPTIENAENNELNEEDESNTKQAPVVSNNTNKADDNISTSDESDDLPLYSIAKDIDNSCDEFCKLKQNIFDAISKTNDLIQKLNNKEIVLSDEEKLQISEQARQLKSLNKQLSHSTTELLLNLNNIDEFLKSSSADDNLTLKYLLVLDNLVNGNELLENSLNSISFINSIISNNPNNTGRLMYGYQYNNNPPYIKDYTITQDGELVENNQNTTDNTSENNASEVSSNPDIPSNRFKPNIDTFGNTNSNIDSFFNTALLNNQFMYGNNYGYGMPGYGYQGYNNYNNPYLQQYSAYENSQREKQTNNYSVENNNNTQDIGNNTKHKSFKIKKNVDTYKDDNTPTIKDRFSKLKSGWNGFYNKFKKNENPLKPASNHDETSEFNTVDVTKN